MVNKVTIRKSKNNNNWITRRLYLNGTQLGGVISCEEESDGVIVLKLLGSISTETGNESVDIKD